MEPQPLKLKLADAEQVTAAMIAVLEADFNLDDLLRNQASEIVRSIHAALFNTGCILVQLDVPAA